MISVMVLFLLAHDVTIMASLLTPASQCQCQYQLKEKLSSDNHLFSFMVDERQSILIIASTIASVSGCQCSPHNPSLTKSGQVQWTFFIFVLMAKRTIMYARSLVFDR